MKFLNILVILILFFWSCNENRTTINNAHIKPEKIEFAKNFSIVYDKSNTIITIYNPWIDAENVSFQYIIDKDGNLTEPNNEKTDLNKSKIGALSTTHIAYLEALDKLDQLKVFSNNKYVFSEKFHKTDNRSKIEEVGFDTNLNIEKLLKTGIKAIFIYGISNDIEPVRQKLIRAGIIPILVGEYTEPHPLGKAEWIKFFGAFFNEKELADSIFKDIKDNYIQLSELTKNVPKKPTVFTGLPWKDTWHIPGGNTITARLIEDAGAKYIFSKDTNSINNQYDIEIVYQKAGNADYWINTGIAQSKEQITGINQRLAMFDAFKNGLLFNNNNRSFPNGGSDYMESGALYPNRILKDLIHIFHPELIPDHSQYYYKQLK